MAEITLTVKHEVGLHARPASLFVQKAKQYKVESNFGEAV
jgi:phosphotransferase system HPr (HPr) family protein